MKIIEKDLSIDFIEYCKKYTDPIVLELGTKQSIDGRSTKHNAWIPNAKEYYGTDFDDGKDVDILADVHKISKVLQNQDKYPKEYDIIISASTFEHIRNPFKATEELSKILKKGGTIFIQTHNCFPIHAYPYDYWRFTIESLEAIMEDAGIKMIDSSYTFPCNIESVQDPQSKDHPSFLLVSAYGVKL